MHLLMSQHPEHKNNPLPLNTIFGAVSEKRNPFITDFDRYLLVEGTHLKSYEKLPKGACPLKLSG